MGCCAAGNVTDCNTIEELINLTDQYKKLATQEKEELDNYLTDKTPLKNFKVTITLPLITFTVPSNSIRVQQFLDYELLKFWVTTNSLTDIPKISDDSDENVGKCGKEQISSVNNVPLVIKEY